MRRIFTIKLILLLALNGKKMERIDVNPNLNCLLPPEMFTFFLSLPAFSSPSPQGSQHGQPAAGSMSTPVSGTVGGGMRRGRWREWRRGDPTLLNNLWKSKTPLGGWAKRNLNYFSALSGLFPPHFPTP